MSAEHVKLGEPVDSASSKPTKRKNSSFIDLIFSPKHKRSKTSGAEASVDRKMADDGTKREGATVKKTKPSLEKSRKKEVKARMNDEASKEIRSLAVGTLAMMASALSNQGRCRASCAEGIGRPLPRHLPPAGQFSSNSSLKRSLVSFLSSPRVISTSQAPWQAFG
jgi:hypothetical protein